MITLFLFLYQLTTSLLYSNGIESVLVVIFFVGLIIFIFIQFHKAVHDKDLYIEALKDMEFKEALEISK